VVFFCPSYEFFVSESEAMHQQIQTFLDAAPPESVMIVEFDDRFDARLLPQADAWDVRVYAPAHVGILRVGAEDEADSP